MLLPLIRNRLILEKDIKLSHDNKIIHAYKNDIFVQPTCTPSRAALLTGMYPFRLGLQHSVLNAGMDNYLSDQYTILPQYLKRLGYATHMIGKWHLGFCNWKYIPTRRGFDTFYGYYNGIEGYYNHTGR